MAKQKLRITNWKSPLYQLWLTHFLARLIDHSGLVRKRYAIISGRSQHYSDLAITTVLISNPVFKLTLCTAQGFINSILSLMDIPLRCPDYSWVSRRAKSVNVSFKTPTRGEIAHLVIDSTGLKSSAKANGKSG